MQCSVFIATTLDGFIAREDGRIDWLSLVECPGEDYGYRQFHDSIDTFIVGRKTYETALGFDVWPYAGKSCLVLTSKARQPQHGEEFYGGTPESVVAHLSATGTRHAYVDGGSVIQQFLAAGLIDEMTVSLIPVLIGQGVRLFGATSRDQPLTLVSSRAFEGGLVQLRYQLRAGTARTP